MVENIELGDLYHECKTENMWTKMGPSSILVSNRHECHSANYRPADQHPGSHASGSNNGLWLPFRWLRFHLWLEPVLHVSGVRTAVEGLPEDAGVGRESWPEGAATGAQTAQPHKR